MIPTAFDEDNDVLGPPIGMTDEEICHLSVYRGSYSDGTPVVISCWKPTREEIEEIVRTGRVWLHIFGQTMPPAFVGGHYPFEIQKDAAG